MRRDCPAVRRRGRADRSRRPRCRRRRWRPGRRIWRPPPASPGERATTGPADPNADGRPPRPRRSRSDRPLRAAVACRRTAPGRAVRWKPRCPPPDTPSQPSLASDSVFPRTNVIVYMGVRTEGDGGGCRRRAMQNGERFPDNLLRPPRPENVYGPTNGVKTSAIIRYRVSKAGGGQVPPRASAGRARDSGAVASRTRSERPATAVAGRSSIASLAHGRRRLPFWTLFTSLRTIHVGKMGTGPICRNGPEGPPHKLDPSPFPGKRGCRCESLRRRSMPASPCWSWRRSMARASRFGFGRSPSVTTFRRGFWCRFCCN